MFFEYQGQSFDTDDIAYFTAQDNGGFIVGEREGETRFQFDTEAELAYCRDYFVSFFPDNERFDFDGWYFVKRHVQSCDVNHFGEVEIRSDFGTVRMQIPAEQQREAQMFLREEMFLR